MIGFFCHEDDIHAPTPEEDAAYRAEGDELQADAQALLATVRHLLSGREIETLEAAADIHNSEGFNVYLIASLKNQFAREIAQWKDGVTA